MRGQLGAERGIVGGAHEEHRDGERFAILRDEFEIQLVVLSAVAVPVYCLFLGRLVSDGWMDVRI